MKNARSHAPISEVVAAASAASARVDGSAVIDIKPQRQHSGLSIEDEEAWMARRRRSLARIRRKRQSRRAGTTGPNPGVGSGWTEDVPPLHLDEVKDRFPILEEEDEFDAPLEKVVELPIEQ